MKVYVTGRGDSYHNTPECGRITGPQKAAITKGYTVHPPREMSLADAMAWKPFLTQCPTC